MDLTVDWFAVHGCDLRNKWLRLLICMVRLFGATCVRSDLVRRIVVSRLHSEVLRVMLTMLGFGLMALLSSVVSGTGSICRCPMVWLDFMKLVMKLSAGNFSIVVGWLHRLRKLFRPSIVT